jgi:hypothetical protein
VVRRGAQRLGLIRTATALAVAVFLAWLGGLVLGEYPFTGFLPILGGAGLGFAVAWAIIRISRTPPPWMAPVAAAIAAYGEVRAVEEDASGGDWTTEGWIAIFLAGAVAGYNIFTATRRSGQSV